MVFQNKANVVKYFLLIVFCSFLFINNANAVTFTVDLEPVSSIGVDKFYCKLKNSTTIYGCGGQTGGTTDFQGGVTYEIQNLYSNNTYPVHEGYYYEFYFSLLDLKNSAYQSQPAGIIWQVRDNDDFAFVTIEQVLDETNQSLMQSGSNTYFFGYNSQNVTFRVLLKARRTGNVVLKIGADISTLIYQDELHYQRVYVYPTVNEYKLKTDGADEMNEREKQADTNIESQSTSDIGGSENQATTNLIGVFSSFLTELQGFSATNCNLALPFPQFIGGTQNVNICQGKDVLGNFITVIGTLAMVGFYIPLAIVLIKMIYNEIRSFTNG